MASIDELRNWFERDLRFASWDENVDVDAADVTRTEVRFFTDTNEYTLTIHAEGDGEPAFDATVRPRKPRAGQTAVRSRRLLPAGRVRLNERTWRRILAGIVGLELVRVHRRQAADAAAEPGAEEAVGRRVAEPGAAGARATGR